tara:strand:+ start:1788 stop:2663 length:876 start_codon:yes stop_codon:yes gene_type:complete
MNLKKILTYNKSTSSKYGWTPRWFGCDEFNEELVHQVISYQREHGLSPDGMVGSSTHRRIYLERMEDMISLEDEQGTGSHIVYAGNFLPIEWDQVILWNDGNGLAAKKGNYRESKTLRKPSIFVNHWDVCLTSQMCQRVLDQRNISVHFLISARGVIYQTMDINDIGYHAGNSNRYSIGVEICNPYYTKYDSWHVKNGLPLRPRWKGVVRGKELEEHLGFYDVQIQAAQALWKAIADACDIPLRCPLVDGKMSDRLYEPALNGWKGFVHHYHLTNRKIDCGGFDLQKYLGK